jgi:hypothetical protein
MIGWIFIISVLAVLVFHYMFIGDRHHARPNVDLQIQKYKTIIDKLSQPQVPRIDLSSSVMEDLSSSEMEGLSSSEMEDLETYIQTKTAF